MDALYIALLPEPRSALAALAVERVLGGQMRRLAIGGRCHAYFGTVECVAGAERLCEKLAAHLGAPVTWASAGSPYSLGQLARYYRLIAGLERRILLWRSRY